MVLPQKILGCIVHRSKARFLLNNIGSLFSRARPLFLLNHGKIVPDPGSRDAENERFLASAV